MLMAHTALIVHLDIKGESFSDFLDLIGAHAVNSQQFEAGCLRFDVMLSTETDNHVVLIEVYESDEALEKHLDSEHMAHYREQVDGMIENRQRYRCECPETVYYLRNYGTVTLGDLIPRTD
ncbi:MAG: hypothetical protein CL397_13940 [Acidiferrobacteraceae bacterium]|jgi:quinol monooxygenase YgiN|nr:hypothetical protein [Acidiferrobacteraceae bacterium]|tara:strand:- start:353 stop:715 length:363 start_codon:yes stop_codon:yes gene_type:complete